MARRRRWANACAGNGGGYIFNGITVLLGLYPMAKYGDLGLRYDRILGCVWSLGVRGPEAFLSSKTLAASLRVLAREDGAVAGGQWADGTCLKDGA